MIVSMTGFASATREDATASVTVTLKSVNHRFLDLQVRAPSSLAGAEAALRGVLQKHVSRGRVDASVHVQYRGVPTFDVTFNAPLVAAVSAAVEQAREAGWVEGRLTASDLVRVPQALVMREIEAAVAGADSTVMALIEAAAEGASADLDAMRRHEGTMLDADLRARRDGLAVTIEDIAAAAEGGRAATEARIHQRVADLRLDPTIDPQAVAQEVVKIVSRSDISEEIVRFRAHLDHWLALTASQEPCGRKLDFLLQEMNREINTIGSKAEGTRVPELIVHAKAELERMREQVQNVE